jgi:trans-2-enoyl-CoA reductase
MAGSIFVIWSAVTQAAGSYQAWNKHQHEHEKRAHIIATQASVFLPCWPHYLSYLFGINHFPTWHQGDNRDILCILHRTFYYSTGTLV